MRFKLASSLRPLIHQAMCQIDEALLERKPGALDHAKPLAGWILPECFLLLLVFRHVSLAFHWSGLFLVGPRLTHQLAQKS